jgi:hypothetical protein
VSSKYIIEVSDEDASWIDKMISNGHSLFVTGVVPRVNMSDRIKVEKQID